MKFSLLVAPSRIENGSRLNEFDVAKGIGILFVIFFHIHKTGIACDIVYSFHMPLFFFISGFLFRKDKYSSFSQFFKKRMQSLFCPYFLFIFVSFAAWTLVQKFYWRNGISGFFDEDTFAFFKEIFIVRQSDKIPFNPPLWFVPCLLLVEFIYYFLSKIKKAPFLFAIVALLAGTGWYLESDYCFFDSSFLPWNLPSALFALSFYFTGNKLFPYLKKFLDKSKPYIFALVFVLVAIIDIPLALHNGHVTLGSRELSNGFIFYITGIAGTLGIISLSKLIQKCRLLKWLGKNSLYMMSTHIPFLSAYSILESMVKKGTGEAPYNYENVLECLLPFIITVIVCSVFTFVYIKIKDYILTQKIACKLKQI